MMPIRHQGFSLIELTMTMALTLSLVAALFALIRASSGASAAQSETADIVQRTRVGVDTLAHDLMGAGAGSYLAGHAGPLSTWLPPILPFRLELAAADPPGTFRTDVISLLSVPPTAAQTVLTAGLGAGSTMLQVGPVPTCAPGVTLCGFSAGLTVLVFDTAGAFQLFTLAAIDDARSQLTTSAGATYAYAAGAAVVAVDLHVYALKTDSATRAPQLVRYDATSGIDAPVLDHVVSMRFDYDIAGAELTDGPWRPDASSSGRWDADLLRLRTVGVTIRLESALSALRGPAGALFSNGGTATSPRAWVPDQEIRFQVSPRNLSLRRR